MPMQWKFGSCWRVAALQGAVIEEFHCIGILQESTSFDVSALCDRMLAMHPQGHSVLTREQAAANCLGRKSDAIKGS